jgi:hypothetical protein
LIGVLVADSLCWVQEIRPMMGERRVMQEALFYGFSLERHVPEDHMLRKIDQVRRLVRGASAPGALL